MTDFIEQDLALIAKGLGFWCSGCLAAQLVVDQSQDPRYCQGCYNILKGEHDLDKFQKIRADSWTDDGMVFITAGQRYGISPAGGSVCMGVVAPQAAATTPLADDRQGLEPVPKYPQVATIGQESSAISRRGNYGTRKRGPGRPRKEDGEPISRRTYYRRENEKERQGRLV